MPTSLTVSVSLAVLACLTAIEGDDDDAEGWGGSLSMMHVASGFFVAGSYGERENTVGAGIEDTTDGWSVTAGMGRKFSPLGKTTFWVRYGEYTGGGVAADGLDSSVWAIGVNQKVDAAAMELYLTYFNVSGDFDVQGVPAAGYTAPAGADGAGGDSRGLPGADDGCTHQVLIQYRA